MRKAFLPVVVICLFVSLVSIALTGAGERQEEKQADAESLRGSIYFLAPVKTRQWRAEQPPVEFLP